MWVTVYDGKIYIMPGTPQEFINDFMKRFEFEFFEGEKTIAEIDQFEKTWKATHKHDDPVIKVTFPKWI